MITHTVKFTARPIGAQGKFTKHTQTIKLSEPDYEGSGEIKKLLYENFEHISNVEVKIKESQLKLYYRDRDRERHIQGLYKLAEICGGTKLQPQTLSNRLRSIERTAKQGAINLCDIPNYNFEPDEKKVVAEVQKLFNGKLQGLFIERDPRGYALKIDEKLLKEGGIYHDLGIHTDFGQDGILAPEIN
jgi:hypothetical protein